LLGPGRSEAKLFAAARVLEVAGGARRDAA
jgi:hypothetical protein